MSPRLAIAQISKQFMNENLELNMQIISDLEESGFLYEFSADYDVSETFIITGAVMNAFGDSDLDDGYAFNQLEDFSHFRLELQYFLSGGK